VGFWKITASALIGYVAIITAVSHDKNRDIKPRGYVNAGLI
jgi:hypothetical protein